MPEPKRLHLTTIRLETEQVAAVAAIATKEKRSFGSTVRVLLADALTRRMRRLRKAA